MIQHSRFVFVRNLALILAVSLVGAAGCSSDETTRQLPAEERFRTAMALYEDGDYLEAIEEFKVVTLQFQGTSFADDAQFYMAECRFDREEFILAAFEYDVLLRTMPTSTFVPRARFQKATCYYSMSPNSYLDQENSRRAIDEYQAFIEYHPTDTLATVAESRIVEMNRKLAEKDFNNGLTYLKLDYNRAAIYYFDVVLEKFHDTPFAEPALLRKAEAFVGRKRFAEARETILKFLEKYPKSEYLEDATEIQKDIVDGEAAAAKDAARLRPSAGGK
jgi:outer membrane protein assembly factor BamD